MSARKSTAIPTADPNKVFLNIPYDVLFEPLYIAYIAGLVELGMVPTATLALSKSSVAGEVPRLDRIFELIQSCSYSVHDLSRVELETLKEFPEHPTPRFNMPFELGLAVAWAKRKQDNHQWFVCEAVQFRLQRSCSDLNLADAYIHEGRPEGVMRELRNAFSKPDDPAQKLPSVPIMMETYEALTAQIPAIQTEAGGSSLFTASMFNTLVYAAVEIKATRPK